MKIVYTGEMDPRLCKSVLGETIPQLAAEDPDVIYLDADLMNCIGTAKWAKANPSRAINCGIAEANMVGVACGLASAGFKPIVHTFGPFASRRCYDQVFLSGGYAKNDITVIGTDPGVTATLNGGTHMPFEDVALYRALPGSTVIDITDPTQLISVLRQCKDRPGVKYIRVGRKQLARVYEDGSELPIGKAVTLREGGDVVIFAAGIMIHEAMQAAQALEQEGISAAVVPAPWPLMPKRPARWWWRRTTTAMAACTPPSARCWRSAARCPPAAWLWRTSSARWAPRAISRSASA